MTVTERIWMTPQAHDRLRIELSALRSGPSIEGHGDVMEYDDTLVANHAARQARIRQLEELLTHAVLGEVGTFLLGVRGAEDADIEVYSTKSPLGSAIAGARPGVQRTYTIPSGHDLPVTLLTAVPYGADPRNLEVHSRSDRTTMTTIDD